MGFVFGGERALAFETSIICVCVSVMAFPSLLARASLRHEYMSCGAHPHVVLELSSRLILQVSEDVELSLEAFRR